ncbi:LOW QUALITY PROTEIN: hypothetical protein Cgig2_016913 [Carnegiea gigantea]|uniref:Uncharacterized protein n=1 Tax=Carnegiea gigantea TaxID=171969 RepID=A0A9Q1GHF4_9CARY|nr:LOW QUALITY PROTEIN: hypothetical protein Cgig2_016913 [Carnegiea gigantea]
MKLVEGRRVSEEAPLTTGVTAPAALEGGSVPLMTGSPIGERPTSQPSPPPPTRGQRPRPAESQRASSHRGTGEGTYKKEFSFYVPRETNEGKANKKLPLFLPLTLDSSRHLFRSGIPSLQDRQPSPRLICIKQQEVRSAPNAKQASIGMTKYPWIRRPVTAKKKSLAKNFSLGSQFNGSRLAPSLLGPLHRRNRLSHEPKDRPRPIVLTYIEHEITGNSSFLSCGFPEGTSPQPDSQRRKRKSYFQYFSFDIFLIAVMKPIVEIVPAQVPSLLGSPLDHVNWAKYPSQASSVVQFTSCYKRTNVVPRHGHNLHRRQFILV